jgi:hypothetical protein
MIKTPPRPIPFDIRSIPKKPPASSVRVKAKRQASSS